MEWGQESAHGAPLCGKQRRRLMASIQKHSSLSNRLPQLVRGAHGQNVANVGPIGEWDEHGRRMSRGIQL